MGFISLSALLAPLVMGKTEGMSIGVALVLLALYLAGAVQAPAPESRLVRAVCYVHYWALGTMTARMTGLLIREFLLTETGLALILGWFYLFCYYNLYKGLECRIRVSEIIFPFFLFLLLFLSLMMLGEVEPDRCRELCFSVDKAQLWTGYQVFVWLGAVQNLWHLSGKTQNPSSYKKAVGAVWLTGAAATVLWGLSAYCIYGENGDTGLVFPLVSAMTLAHFPGNVIGRLDALFVFVWVMGLFLLCSTLFAPLQGREPDKREKYLLAALMAASFGLAMQPECILWCRSFLCYVSTPVQIFLMIWYGVKKKGRRAAVLGLLFLPFFFLSGCAQQELEERSIVTAIGVDAGEGGRFYFTFGFGTSNEEEGEEPFGTEAVSLAEAKKRYYEYSQKNMDFNHLKNFYFSQEVMRREEFSDLLEEIQVSGVYSRGTSVYGTEGSASREAEKKEQPKEGTPVHRLLNAWYNKETCEIPEVTEEQVYKGSILWP